MLKKVLQQNLLVRQSKPFFYTATRSFLTYPNKNYIVPESLEETIKYLDKKRPAFTLLYFTAKWNPIIPKIEKDYEETTKKFQQFEHIRVDCDTTPLIKMYFDARVEPQFLILLNGAEFQRIIGYNFDRIHSALERTTELQYQDFQYNGTSKNTWERFYDQFDRFARTGEADRDSTRPWFDPVADQWRGAGTNNP